MGFTEELAKETEDNISAKLSMVNREQYTYGDARRNKGAGPLSISQKKKRLGGWRS